MQVPLQYRPLGVEGSTRARHSVWWRRLRHGWRRLAATGDQLPVMPRHYAIALVALLFVVGWGTGVRVAIEYLIAPTAPELLYASIPAALAKQLPEWATIAVCLVALLATLRIFGIRPAALGLRRPRSLSDWGWEAGAALWWFAALGVGGFLGSRARALWGGEAGYPGIGLLQGNGVELAGTLLSVTLAGPAEEIILVAGLVVAFQAARIPLPVILAVGIALRVSFHLYYGPAIALTQHLAWAIGVLLGFLLMRRILGMVVMHSLANAIAAVTAYTGMGLVFAQLVYFLVFAGLLVLVILGMRSRQKARRRGRAPTQDRIRAAEAVVDELAHAAGMARPKVVVKGEYNASARGGSQLELGSRLLAEPVAVIGPVIAHEFAHLEEWATPKAARRRVFSAVGLPGLMLVGMGLLGLPLWTAEPPWWWTGAVIAAIVAMVALILANAAQQRALETAADARGAELGYPMTLGTLRWLNRAEHGAIASLLPTWLRLHPKPADRAARFGIVDDASHGVLDAPPDDADRGEPRADAPVSTSTMATRARQPPPVRRQSNNNASTPRSTPSPPRVRSQQCRCRGCHTPPASTAMRR
ncbi:putative membrane protein [Naumannella cuiyingiana]|uniref:Putative membrane protein n=1 Tax=Naumannella cuiyingiana TaxID=1347891 RepID=A0A7Z0DCC2_9ACTN|nr:M48 family metalloprotease [Naumannella cuiyingiana]NYI72718.1 putative membrane protein [Naumannella cuiyingiana]